MKGSRCEICGYASNYAAPEFHHVNPDLKKFQLDMRSLSNRKWSAVLDESLNCRLVCSNCHAELHHPGCNL
jgi:hypothetical protein